jgi:4-hydroxy-3-polyprenylbenzoate decarboxylase
VLFFVFFAVNIDMAYADLREFIKVLDKNGELKRISLPVSSDQEITEVTDRVSKSTGHNKALLFENVDGGEIPVLINALGSRRRMELALEVDDVEDVAARLTEWLDFKSPEGLLEKVKMLPKLAELGKYFPRTVKSGPCQEVIKDQGEFSLFDFPILRCWEADGGRFITFPMVITRNPRTGKRNCGMYRMQVYDGETTGMHWQIHKHGAAHHRDEERRGTERMEVAVAIGAEPITNFAATLPLPDDLDELIFASFLREKPIEMVKCVSLDLEVPATAEIILEGYVDPSERRMEGPFGDHTGFYTLEEPYPVFHVTAVTHRKKPIYQTTIVGRPPMEDYWMGWAITRITLPVLKRQLPEIVDMYLPPEGIFHNLMLISIRKQYPGHARKIMNAIWGLGQAMFTKCIVVVDEDVNVQDPSEVAWKVLNNIDPERDIQFMFGPIDVLDHAARQTGFGSKMGIDGTRKWKAEGFDRRWPKENSTSPEVKRMVDEKWKKLGLW